MVLCGTWSETSVAQSQLTQFWQIPRHRTLSYSLWTPFFLRLPPSGGIWKYAKDPSTKKKLGEILYLLICSFVPCLSWLLRSRVRKSRRDSWITLYCTTASFGMYNTEEIRLATQSYFRSKKLTPCLHFIFFCFPVCYLVSATKPLRPVYMKFGTRHLNKIVEQVWDNVRRLSE